MTINNNLYWYPFAIKDRCKQIEFSTVHYESSNISQWAADPHKTESDCCSVSHNQARAMGTIDCIPLLCAHVCCCLMFAAD